MTSTRHDKSNGILLVAGSALLWSFGGTIARFISIEDSWTIVFWRALFAALFLLCYMLWRDGWRGTLDLFRSMGRGGLLVSLCFTVASTSFVIALAYTTVANILLMQAGVPLIAALMSFLLFRERIALSTWLAIAAVICGVAVMVSESFTGSISPIGDGLSLLIAFAFATATVVTRRSAHVHMMPAVCTAMLLSALIAAVMTQGYAVSTTNLAWLFAFGAINLGAGLALFSMGARLIPAALAALVGTLEPVLGPLWVWLVHGELPSERTLIGGAVVFLALLVHLMLEWLRPQVSHQPDPPAGNL